MGLSTLLWLRPSRLGANGNDFEIGEQPGDFTDLSELLWYIMVNFTVVLVAVTTLFFFWGLYKFIRSLHQGDSEGVTSGKQFMVWGVIALFLSLFFLGVVALLNFTIWGGPGLDFPLLPGSES